MNEHITFDQTSQQAFDVMSPKTRACNFLGAKGKPNKKVTNNKRVYLEGLDPLQKPSKNIHKMQKKWRC